jgi:hypothetical protein
MTTATTVAVIGSGSLASAVCRSLALCAPVAGHTLAAPGGPGSAIEVLVLARDPAAAATACLIAGSLASLAHRPVSFRSGRADLADPAGLQQVLRAAGPAGLILCASYQSPWERLRAPSAWTAALAGAGLGLSLPLQAVPAIMAGRALAQACPHAWFINTCFPDAVNPVLAHLGVPVACGAGNVAMLAAALQQGLGQPDGGRVKVVAHHAHLHEPADPADEAWAWLDDQPMTGLAAALSPVRAAPRQRLVEIAGASAARLASALLAGTRLEASAPGPLGLPGGYPVRIEDGTVSLRLPPGCTAAEAIAFNQRAALRDGAVVEAGTVRFGPAARDVLGRELPALADGFPVSDITSACDRLLELRARLRARPPVEVAP